MSQYSDSKFNDSLTMGELSLSESFALEKKSSNLKLIISNPSPVPPELKPSSIIRSTDNSPSFTVNVRLRGVNLYEMVVQDSSHLLICELNLEVEENRNKSWPGTVICHFPMIEDKKFEAFVEEDETLYGIIMVQFQMRVLEQLLLFCTNHRVSRLIIYTDNGQAEELGIYEEFLFHRGQNLTSRREKTEMTISIDQNTYGHWTNFMKEVNLRFGQDLWRQQRYNSAIRRYLKFCHRA